MKRTFLFLSLVFIFAAAVSAFGSPLRLDYGVTDLGSGLFDYKFNLVLDNNDGKWGAGDGWGWILFGDAPGNSSQLTDFVGDTGSLDPAGPFTGFGLTTGGHSGPNLAPAFPTLWIPSGIGDSYSWSGTSSTDLAQGDLLFSTLNASPGAKKANFEVAMRTMPGQIPEPGTLLLFGVGLIGLIGFSRRRFKK